MYKSVNINQETYKQLQKISTQLNKPKAQVVQIMLKKYSEDLKKTEQEKLEKFNNEMDKKIKALCFSKKVEINTSNIDPDFAALGKTNYIP